MNEIDTSQLLAQLRANAAQAQGKAMPAAGTPEAGQSQGVDFASLLKKSMDSVNELQNQSGTMVKAFETGDPSVSLAEVMIARKKSEIAFQSMLQVRNKLVEAYKEVMSMPV